MQGDFIQKNASTWLAQGVEAENVEQDAECGKKLMREGQDPQNLHDLQPIVSRTSFSGGPRMSFLIKNTVACQY